MESLFEAFRGAFIMLRKVFDWNVCRIVGYGLLEARNSTLFVQTGFGIPV